MGIAAVTNLPRRLVPRPWRPAVVHFVHSCPDNLERARIREQVKQSNLDDVEQRTRTPVYFRSALDFAQEQAKLDKAVALELAHHCPTLAVERVAPGANDLLSAAVPTSPLTPPTLPPPTRQEEYEEWEEMLAIRAGHPLLRSFARVCARAVDASIRTKYVLASMKGSVQVCVCVVRGLCSTLNASHSALAVESASGTSRERK